MDKLRAAFRRLKENYDLIVAKKYTTIAGTLVFFLIMSIMPMTFWVSLLFGELPVDSQRILDLPVFESVKDIFLYIQQEAQNATNGASFFLLVTTLYSATNLFYQMRRTGELIYDYHLKRQGVRMRLGAVALLFFVLILALLIVIFFSVVSFLLSTILSDEAEVIVDYCLLALGAFTLVLLLNIYVCPYRVKPSVFFPGAVFTVGAWSLALVGFAVYLRFSNVTRLYGVLSTLIVFMLWLYVLMVCFVIGVVLNCKKVIGTER